MAEPWSQAALYVEVQQHQARQMHALDGGKFEEYADTFTPDGLFRHTPGREPARGREQIASELYEFHERFAGDPVQRRHMFTMLAVDELDDSSIQADFYTLVLTTRTSGLTVGPSCPVRDVLVRGEDGRLLTASRMVEHNPRIVADQVAAIEAAAEQTAAGATVAEAPVADQNSAEPAIAAQNHTDQTAATAADRTVATR